MVEDVSDDSVYEVVTRGIKRNDIPVDTKELLTGEELRSLLLIINEHNLEGADVEFKKTSFLRLNVGTSEKFNYIYYDGDSNPTVLRVEYVNSKEPELPGAVYDYFDVPKDVALALEEAHRDNQSVGSRLYRLVEPDKRTKEVKYRYVEVE